MCAMTQSSIEPQLGRVCWGCGSIVFGGVVSLLLAACARRFEDRRLTPTAWGCRPCGTKKKFELIGREKYFTCKVMCEHCVLLHHQQTQPLS